MLGTHSPHSSQQRRSAMGSRTSTMAAKGEKPSVHERVEYRLFPLIPNGFSSKDEANHLEEQLDQILAQLGQHLVNYIWQNEPFNLRVVPSAGGVQAHLYGSTDYGDNVEDEWFITYLMYELTQAMPGLIVKVWDTTDGEFLLIEAADHLPKWLNPDTADNRVFIHNGDVHVVPQPQTPAEVGLFPAGEASLEQGLQAVRGHPGMTEAPRRLQKAVNARLKGYPGKVGELQHVAHMYVPANLAAVLSAAPQLAAPMVHAFYLRDPIDLKSCVTFRTFRPGSRVTTAVKMTRCLYAQLSQQRFAPDRRSGYILPSPSAPHFKQHELGMKLAHGAEILCARCTAAAPPQEDLVSLSRTDIRWQRFVTSLNAKGYFRGELEGSVRHQQLTDAARQYFYGSVGTTDRHSSEPGDKLASLLRSLKVNVEEWKQKESNLPQEDDDSWLSVTPEQFEAMLQQQPGKAGGEGSEEAAFDLSAMADSMKHFVEKTSSYEGAELPKAGCRDSTSSDISFDPNSFIHTMQKMFEFDDDVGSRSSSDMDEYGSDDDLEEPSMSPPPQAKPTMTVPKPQPGREGQPVGDLLNIQDYMEIMDRELATTKVGQSFERETAPAAPKAPPRRKKQSKPSPSSSPASTSAPKPSRPTSKPPARPSQPPPRPARPPRPAKSPAASGPKAPKATLEDDFDLSDDDDDYRPVDVDMTVVKNLLESYNSQEGLAGPTSNVMGAMGVHLPKNADK